MYFKNANALLDDILILIIYSKTKNNPVPAIDNL